MLCSHRRCKVLEIDSRQLFAAVLCMFKRALLSRTPAPPRRPTVPLCTDASPKSPERAKESSSCVRTHSACFDCALLHLPLFIRFPFPGLKNKSRAAREENLHDIKISTRGSEPTFAVASALRLPNSENVECRRRGRKLFSASDFVNTPPSLRAGEREKMRKIISRK